MAIREIIKRNPSAAAIAIVMHLVIIAFMLVGVDWLKPPKQPNLNVEVVQARVVDEKLVAAEVEKLKQAEEKKKAVQQAEEKRLQELKQKQAAEKQRLADLEKKRKAEEKKRQQAETKRKAEEKKRKQAEQKRLAEEKKRKAAEAKRIAEEKRLKEAEAKRVAEEKKRVEEQRRKEAEAKRIAEEKKRKAAEAKRLAEEKKRKEAEARRLAEEKKRKAAEAAAAKAREDELLAAMEAEQNQREIDRYIVQIKQKVVRSWTRPAGISDGLSCKLRVRMGPGGAVLAVSVVESSNVGAFDRSAQTAVLKADPLPVPGGNLFESFREIIFEFDPNT